MPISVAYRPATTITTGYMVALDGWAAGAPGQTVESANSVVDAQGTEWYVTKLEGWSEAPDPRTSLTNRPGEHGAYDGAAFLTPRTLTIEGVAIATSRTAAWRARDILSSVCGDPRLGLSTLVVTQAGYVNRRMLVRRGAVTKTAPMSAVAFRWSMLLVAPDPRRYADTQSTLSVGLAQPGADGLVFSLVFPLVFGTGASGGGMTLTNTGTLATWPTWTVLGPTSGLTITNSVTGDRLAFDPAFSLAGGETVVIDTDAKTVLQSGVNRRDRLFTAQWFRLEPGDTSILFTAGSNPATQLTASWRDAWT